MLFKVGKMLGSNEQHSRLCVLESLYKQAKEQNTVHMKVQDECFRDIRDSMKDILLHLDKNKEENTKVIEALKKDIVNLIEREYVTSIVMRDEHTVLKTSILKAVRVEFKRYLGELGRILFVITIVVSAAAWVFTHVDFDRVMYSSKEEVKK